MNPDSPLGVPPWSHLGIAAPAADGSASSQATDDPASGRFTEARPLEIGMLLFDGFEPLDVFGPIEVFGSLGARTRIITVAAEVTPVRPRFGPGVLVDRTISEAGPLDLLIIPGGRGTRAVVADAAFVGALRQLAEVTPRVATVCTGSGLLARTGLLTGRRATSNKQAFAWAMSQDPSVQWVYESRWVVDGKYATSSGVSAGMDLSLSLVAALFDHDTAVKTAQYLEYIWNEEATRDPFAALHAAPR